MRRGLDTTTRAKTARPEKSKTGGNTSSLRFPHDLVQQNTSGAVYCDSRRESYTGIWKSTKNDSERQCVIAPDIQCDFTDLPFADDTFTLVIFDPPHLERAGENSWMRKKYGVLSDNWPQMLHDGFRECMRVLKPDGVLIFKWSEVQIEAKKVWEAIGEKPLFGHRSGKQAKTFWGCFMKLGLPEAPEGGDKHE